VPTNQVLQPAGKQVLFPGRPVDLAFADGGQTLVVKNLRDLVFLDTGTGAIKQTLASPVGFSVVGLLVHGEFVYASDVRDHVRVARRRPDGSYQWLSAIALAKPQVGGAAHPAGIARDEDGFLWVTSTRGNNVQRIDPQTGKVEQVVPVGIAPYQICFRGPDRAYVSNWGGDPPAAGDASAPSAGSPARIDPKTGIASDGTVSVLGKRDGTWRTLKTVRVGLHPSGLALGPRGKLLYVANANSDTVSVLDTARDEIVATIPCRPEARLPFGSGANAVALSPDGTTLYVANGTNNCLAVVQLGARATEEATGPAESRLLGLIPTGWYPGAIRLSADGKKLYVANVKGHGSLSRPRPAEKGRNSHDHLGSASLIDVPDAARLARSTATVHANNRLAYSLAGLEKPRPDVKPVPVPLRHGEPSVIEHVIYVIKENRTYDQVFGDLPEGNGDPSLVLFGEDVTPNHHALARQFTLFDNFYCSGVLSADGHQWVNEAYVTDYLEKSFGGFTRSYPYEGSDPLAYASSGFLWDNALARQKTFRNYGEFVQSSYPKGTTWADVYNDYRNGTRKVNIKTQANVKTLAPHTRAGYPGFPLTTPDVYRASLFLEDFRAYEHKGTLPNLIYVFLPADHTSGTRPGLPTPRASVADNDLALGKIVEAVSQSKFWPKTCIFSVEDDPQNGFDHVDGHRTVALAISPYTRRHYVDHTNYNQTGMVKTIELMLGLPPMNQLDLSATPMRSCFQAEPDVTRYTCRPNQIPLDEMNPPAKALRGPALHWAKKSLELDLDKEDQADEDTLNRILWHATRGYATPYPERYAGRREAAEEREREKD
jgi:YVTN family beta-propeller protein